MKRGSKLLCIGLVALSAAAVFYLAPRPGGRVSGEMSQSAYVWQRAWTEAVSDAVAEHGTNFTELVPLNAEVSWKNRTAKTVRVPLDPRALRGTGPTIGLALRIGAYPGPFKPDDAQAVVLTELAASLVAEAASNRLSVAELQLDFDCAESKLDGYAVWVKAIQSKVKPVPVTITALPAWLKRSAFKRLIDAADGYVLQVHSLARPKNADASFKLCDPPEARRAVERAARLGKPFRVALPTYGYVMAFGPNGQFIGLSAEGPAPSWPEGTQLREIRADPAAMAQMVQAWNTERPQALAGVIWYRLPVSQDRLNWSWPTLAAVMSGKVPEPDVRAEVRQPDPALSEIDLVNAGTVDYSGPVQVTVRWPAGQLVASDGLLGFDSNETGSNSVQFQSRNGLPRLQAGERRSIGWVRLSKETEVQIEVAQLKN
jgi:hypothetical protein